MEEAFTVAGMIALAVKVVDVIRNARHGRNGLNSVLTQCLAWAAGIGVTSLYAQTSFAESLVFKIPNHADLTLATATWADQAVIGIAIVSIGSIVVDFKKSRDNSDSAAVPPLYVPGSDGHASEPVDGAAGLTPLEVTPEEFGRGAIPLAAAPRPRRRAAAKKRPGKKAPAKKRAPAKRR